MSWIAERVTIVAEVTVRRLGQIMQAAFAVLIDHPEGLRAGEVIRQVENRLPPTPFEAASYPRNPRTRRFDKLVRFVTIYPVKAGWLLKDAGRWTITTAGIQAFQDHPDPEDLKRTVNRLYRDWDKTRPGPDQEPSVEDPNRSDAALTVEEAEETAWQEIEQYLAAMNPYDFQNLVAALLHAMGYHVAWVAPPGRDGGIDILAYTDPLGAQGPRIVVQVRHRQEKATRDALRTLLAILGEEDVGLFVSASGFTAEAQEEARSQERRRLTLVDLAKLFGLWAEYYGRVAESDRALLPLKAVYYLGPSISTGPG